MKKLTTKRGAFRSHWGFVLACIGSAVGMGNIWMFPTRVSAYGGGSFLIPYIIFVIVIGFSGVVGEMAFGRYTHAGPVGAFGEACASRGESKRKLGELIGCIPMFGALALAIGYTVVVGWILKYMQQVGVKFLDGLIEFCAGRKNVRVRQGDQTDLIRFFAQGLEAGLAGRAALELYLIVVAGTGGQVVQLVVEQVHLAALEVGCVCVDLHLDRVTELALVGAVCDGRGDLLRAFPYDDHAVGLWCQKVGAVLELCAAASRKCSRCHGHDHNSCDHSRA